MNPRLFVGRRTAAKILEIGVGYLDDGSAYNLYGLSDRLAPNGAEGEALFETLFFALRAQSAIKLRVTPIVDEVALEPQTIQLAATAGVTRRIYELALSVPIMVSGIEVSRAAPRGTWLQVLVETIGNGTTELLGPFVLDAVEVLATPVTESKNAVA